MFRIKQWIKMILQNCLLPVIYTLCRRQPVEQGLVLFADGRHTQMPFSMRQMYRAVQTLEDEGRCKTEQYIVNFDEMNFFSLGRFLFQFMRRYACADYVFICDYFLPVSSCKKRPETKVVQLWHSCGLLKKIAHDARDDIPEGYHGDLFGNYTCVTVSAQVCVPVLAHAMQISEDRVCATGVSRTDCYFDRQWNDQLRMNFFRLHPSASGKKIAVWAPTFRGNASHPRLEGLPVIRRVMEELKEEWFFVIKAHPLLDAREKVSNSSIPTEELFAVADVVITDYSSVLFDYLLYQKPAILFAPDLGQYEAERGFYIEYGSIPYPLAQTEEELIQALQTLDDWQGEHSEEITEFCRTYSGRCDGHATERILNLIGLTEAAQEGVSCDS